MDETPDLINKEECGKEIAADPRTVDRYRNLPVDPLPYIQFSKRHVRFSRAAVRAWIARRTVGEVAR